MRRLVLASHGKLSEGMKDSVQYIIGKSTEIFTICAYVDPDVSLEKQIDNLFEQFAETDEIIVVTDIFGGSVNNEFVRRLDTCDFWLISGMTLPLVIQLVMILEEDNIREKIEEAVEAGREMLCFCNPIVKDAVNEQEDF